MSKTNTALKHSKEACKFHEHALNSVIADGWMAVMGGHPLIIDGYETASTRTQFFYEIGRQIATELKASGYDITHPIVIENGQKVFNFARMGEVADKFEKDGNKFSLWDLTWFEGDNNDRNSAT